MKHDTQAALYAVLIMTAGPMLSLGVGIFIGWLVWA